MTTFRSLPQPSDQLDDALVKDMNREFKLAAHIQTALDTIMDNHARSIRIRTQKIMAGDLVECAGRRGRVVSTDEGFARVVWEYGLWEWVDFKSIEVVR